MQRTAKKQHNMVHRPPGKQKLVVNLQLSKAELKSFLIEGVIIYLLTAAFSLLREGCVEGKLLRA